MYTLPLLMTFETGSICAAASVGSRSIIKPARLAGSPRFNGIEENSMAQDAAFADWDSGVVSFFGSIPCKLMLRFWWSSGEVSG